MLSGDSHVSAYGVPSSKDCLSIEAKSTYPLEAMHGVEQLIFFTLAHLHLRYPLPDLKGLKKILECCLIDAEWGENIPEGSYS